MREQRFGRKVDAGVSLITFGALRFFVLIEEGCVEKYCKWFALRNVLLMIKILSRKSHYISL